MIAAFFVLGLVATICVAITAAAVETILAQTHRPLRGAWASALALSLVLVASSPWRRAVAPAPVAPSAAVATTNVPVIVTLSSAANRLPRATPNVLLVAWAIASGALLLLLALVHLRYARLRRRWPIAEINGATVRVAPNYGPGVIGLARPEIVVPRWLLDRPVSEQAMVITHEREHLRAGDPLLLGAAWIVAALVPWSPAVWWMLNRLRLAMELDCDARVLGDGAVPQIYGNVLIDVAALRSGIRLPAGAFLDSGNNLQRRLRAMHPTRIRFATARAAAAGVVALGALLAACEAKLPTTAEIQHMDVASAERAAKANGFVGDTIVYLVNGVRVTEAQAETIPDSMVASVEFVTNHRGGAQLSVKTIRQPWAFPVLPPSVDLKAVDFNATAEVDTGFARQAPGGGMRGRVGRSGEISDERGPGRVRRQITREVAPDAISIGDKFGGLIFVDGKQVDPSTLRNYPVSKIESIEIVKGAAAAAAYSDPAAANGVIKVKTRP